MKPLTLEVKAEGENEEEDRTNSYGGTASHERSVPSQTTMADTLQLCCYTALLGDYSVLTFP